MRRCLNSNGEGGGEGCVVQFSLSSGTEGAVDRERFVDGGRVELGREASVYIDETGRLGESEVSRLARDERLEAGWS